MRDLAPAIGAALILIAMTASLKVAGVLNRWNWPAKRKTNIEFVNRLSDQIADLSLTSFRQRTERSK